MKSQRNVRNYDRRDNGKRKTKIESKNFSKPFSNFYAGITEVYEMSCYLKELFENVVEPADVYKKLAEIASDYTPNIESRENMLWEVHISGNRCHLKTNNFIGFGWQIRTVKEGEVYNSTYTFMINVIGSNPELEAQLAENYWEQNTNTK